MIRIFLKGICLILLAGCSRELSVQQYKDYLYDSANGLSKELRIESHVFKVTYWPRVLVEAKGLGQGMHFFAISSEDHEQLFIKNETHFKLLASEVEYAPVIAFAENTGMPESTRLLVGFPIDFLKDDLRFQFLSDGRQVIADLIFFKDDLSNIEQITINP